MLWILFGLSMAILVLCICFESELTSAVAIFSLVVLIIICFCLFNYNDTKKTADKQIAVLEKRNEEVISQIEPLVKQYLEYEASTFKDLKPNADMLIAFAQYPELKGNEFVQTQILIILENQKRITTLKLDKARLNGYKLWLFMGE